MGSRDEERRLAKLAAEREPLNTNTFNRNVSPPSIRTVTESQTVEHEPVPTDRVTGGMVGVVPPISRVRDRLAATEEKKLEMKPAESSELNLTPAQQEELRRRSDASHGAMGSNGRCR
jgi:hypothetical protein